jgi:hypothetical protein
MGNSMHDKSFIKENQTKNYLQELLLIFAIMYEYKYIKLLNFSFHQIFRVQHKEYKTKFLIDFTMVLN